MGMELDKEIVDEFLSESREHLETIEEDFLALEKQKEDPDMDLVNKVFRAIHTIKGGAGFLELIRIHELSHVMETLLSRVRDKDIQPDSIVVGALLEGVDMLSSMLDNIEDSNEMDIADIHGKLSDMLSDDGKVIEPQKEASVTVDSESKEVEEKKVKKGTKGAKATKVTKATKATKTAKSKKVTKATKAKKVTKAEKDENVTKDDDISQTETAPINKIEESVLPVKQEKAVTAKTPTKDRSSSTIRLSVEILDKLMMLAGELVLVRNQQLIHADKSDSSTKSIVQRLDLVTSDLQETIMRTRMQPIGNVFNKFTRVVRDLGNKVNKKIEIDISGTEVELDKTILESLTDPLTHLIRNCCDHGIESTEERISNGKSPIGHIALKAFHEGGQINIEIEDDGKGINVEVIKKKVLEKNLKTEAELAQMSDKELTTLILLPGFSTAEKVSDLSGRGVGMDVVKSNIENLGGTVDIESVMGKGTTMHLRLPLTLAIIPCLIVSVGEYRYAIPQVNLVELMSLYDDEVYTKIESAGKHEVFRLRDTLLPMVRLEELLQRKEPFTDEVRASITEKYRKEQEARLHNMNLSHKGNEEVEDAKEGVDDISKGVINSELTESVDNGKKDQLPKSQSLNFTVLKVGSKRFGLIVDKVLGTEEIVVKPMHPVLKPLNCYSGATVMGDGKVALILDIDGIAKHVGVDLNGLATDKVVEDHTESSEKQSVLLFQYGEKEQFAVSLPLIKRIEYIETKNIEDVGGKGFITIDGVSTLVLRLEKVLMVSPPVEKERMYLLLPKHIKKPFGILISSLSDIAETSMELNDESYIEDGLLGTDIVNEHITLFIDIYRLAELAMPEWFTEDKNAVDDDKKKNILLLEDAPFFRQLIKGYLTTNGFDVMTAENGELGLELFNKSDFDLVVSDIEMPVMDGREFMRNVRNGDRNNQIPAIAVTSLDSEDDRQKVIQSGYDRYETKFNRDSFMNAVNTILGIN